MKHLPFQRNRFSANNTPVPATWPSRAIRLLALVLLVITPFVYVFTALKDHWSQFTSTSRFLLAVIRHGENAWSAI